MFNSAGFKQHGSNIPVAHCAIVPKGFQLFAGGKLATPPESNQKNPISRRDDSDRVFCHPFGIGTIEGTLHIVRLQFRLLSNFLHFEFPFFAINDVARKFSPQNQSLY